MAKTRRGGREVAAAGAGVEVSLLERDRSAEFEKTASGRRTGYAPQDEYRHRRSKHRAQPEAVRRVLVAQDAHGDSGQNARAVHGGEEGRSFCARETDGLQGDEA